MQMKFLERFPTYIFQLSTIPVLRFDSNISTIYWSALYHKTKRHFWGIKVFKMWNSILSLAWNLDQSFHTRKWKV